MCMRIARSSPCHCGCYLFLPQAVAIKSNGSTSPLSNMVPVTTPSTDEPVLDSATPTSPTTATAVITPPASGGPYPTYNVTLCPSSGAGTCVTATCSNPTSCPITGLQPGTTYSATVRRDLWNEFDSLRPVTHALAAATVQQNLVETFELKDLHCVPNAGGGH